MSNINIYGVLHNDTPDGIIARTEQIADTEGNKLSDKLSKISEDLGEIDTINQSITDINKKLSPDNFKTVNGESVYGPGEITITSEGKITVDAELSETSINPVQNKVITAAISTTPNTKIETAEIDTMMIETSVLRLSSWVDSEPVNELGVDTDVKVYWQLSNDDIIVNPDSVSISGQPVSEEDINNGYKTISVNKQTTFQIDVIYNNKDVNSATVTNPFIKPTYIGTTATESFDGDFGNLSNSQKILSLEPIQNVSIDTNNEYMWICSPDVVNNVRSKEGFIIPTSLIMEKNEYKYYRTVDKPQSEITILSVE